MNFIINLLFMLIAGVDEVGRGALAGPVVAAAVILDNDIEGLNDSKKLTERKRNRERMRGLAVQCSAVTEL